MSFWKKLCYLLISVVLVCSCLCAVSYRGTSLETLTEPSLSELDLSETVGYEVEDLGDAIRFTPTAEGAVFKLRGNEAWEGFVVLELAEPISDNYSTMSGTKPDGQYVGTSVSTGLLSEDGTKVYYPLDSGMLKGAFSSTLVRRLRSSRSRSQTLRGSRRLASIRWLSRSLQSLCLRLRWRSADSDILRGSRATCRMRSCAARSCVAREGGLC